MHNWCGPWYRCTPLVYIEHYHFGSFLISCFYCILPVQCMLEHGHLCIADLTKTFWVVLTLTWLCQDLNRQVVRSDSASVKIPELDFEIPASSQKGTLSTIEGIISRAIEGLQQEQPVRQVRPYPLNVCIIIHLLKKLFLLKTIIKYEPKH